MGSDVSTILALKSHFVFYKILGHDSSILHPRLINGAVVLSHLAYYWQINGTKPNQS